MTPTTKRRIWIGSGILLLGVLALPKILELRATADTAAPPPGASGALVTVETIGPTTFQETYATTGTLMGDEEVRLRSEIAGRIVEVNFQEGMRVDEGALLVKMFDDDLQARRARIENQLALAEREWGRQKALLTEGGTTQQLYDRALSDRDVLRAELKEIEADLIRTEIRAPFAGVVGLRTVSPGAYLTPGSEIAMLRVLNPMKLEFSVPERLGPQVRIGTPVEFTVQGRDESFEGTVYASEPGVDERTRTIRFRARVSNPNDVLRPGAFARVQVKLGSPQSDAILVPTVAVVANGAQQTVFVYRGGTAEPRAVQTGARTRDRVQIRSGLSPGDTLVVSGVQNVRPGIALQIDTSATAFRPDSIRVVDETATGTDPSSNTP